MSGAQIVIVAALATPVHSLLESTTWLVGAWQTSTVDGDRFPVRMSSGAYRERMEIRVHSVPQFDRPPLNIR